ncbi:hypothetical protein SASPL_146484 [Salvia splendens]|uniref:S-locus glycoprotein domain-containing protein n=1 Tax=Salvia splendens TaxID=180675 RepID=A0A8X8WCU1_SALSN|nr:hypothetical protein SASPL_146484 [Salvia splendens]
MDGEPKPMMELRGTMAVRGCGRRSKRGGNREAKPASFDKNPPFFITSQYVYCRIEFTKRHNGSRCDHKRSRNHGISKAAVQISSGGGRDGRPQWRSGPWNGLIFIGIQSSYLSFLDGFVDVTNDSAGTFYYTMPQWKIVNRVTLNSSGSLVETMWDFKNETWWAAPENECNIYGTCGPFGNCNVKDSPVCCCVEGFEPASREEWARGN